MKKTETTSIETNKKYTYNSSNDTYVIPLKCAAKPLVLSGDKHRAIVKAFSGSVSKPVPIEEIAARMDIPLEYLEEYKRIFGLTKDCLPLSDEEVEQHSIEKNARHLLDEKKFAVFQQFEKELWKETQRDADSWREFKAKQLNPFFVCLENWTPPKFEYIKKAKPPTSGDKTLLIVLNDLHYGLEGKARYMYGRKDWNTKKTVEGVAHFAKSIIQYAGTKKFKYKKVIIIGLGDLIHSLNGKTTRGTELKYDCIKEEQFEYALDSLSSFIFSMAEEFGNVEVHSVGGNHNYEAEMALWRALAKGFSTDDRIKFNNHETRPASFKDGKTLIMLDHGADDESRSYVPTASDNKLQLHVQDILLTKPELLTETKSKLFIVGDKHHWENVEYNNFEFIMCGCPQGGNDEYSDQKNLNSRGRQTCFTLDENKGLEEIFHVYFD